MAIFKFDSPTTHVLKAGKWAAQTAAPENSAGPSYITKMPSASSGEPAPDYRLALDWPGVFTIQPDRRTSNQIAPLTPIISLRDRANILIPAKGDFASGSSRIREGTQVPLRFAYEYTSTPLVWSSGNRGQVIFRAEPKLYAPNGSVVASVSTDAHNDAPINTSNGWQRTATFVYPALMQFAAALTAPIMTVPGRGDFRIYRFSVTLYGVQQQTSFLVHNLKIDSPLGALFGRANREPYFDAAHKYMEP